MPDNKLQSGDPLILDEENDLLKVLPKVKFLKEFIEDNFKKGGLFESDSDNSDRMIALYGGWGTGKSSVMKTLCESNDVYTIGDTILEGKKAGEKKYGLENIETVFFEAWKYEKDDNLALSLYTLLLDHFGKDREGFFKELEGVGTVFRQGLAKGINFTAGIPGVASVSLSSKPSIEDMQKYFEKNLENMSFKKQIDALDKGFNYLNIKKNLVIFIDDLDRCESENVINLLSAIKLFFTYMPKTVFVVGIDKKAVMLGLMNKYNNDENKADEYLEKIFTMSFNMPRVVSMEKFVDLYLEGPKSVLVKEMLQAIGFANPRHVKKLLNKVVVCSKEINKLGLDDKQYMLFIFFAYLYEFESKNFYEAINLDGKLSNYKNSTRYVETQSNAEMNKSLVDTLPDSEYSFILPYFSKEILLGTLTKGGITGGIHIYINWLEESAQIRFARFLNDKKYLQFGSTKFNIFTNKEKFVNMIEVIELIF